MTPEKQESKSSKQQKDSYTCHRADDGPRHSMGRLGPSRRLGRSYLALWLSRGRGRTGGVVAGDDSLI
jgi:hypothetical protein